MSRDTVQTPVPLLWAVAAVSMVMTMQADLASAAVTTLLPDCDGCHCSPAQGTNGTCPELPTLPDTAELRKFEHLNPMTINCNPMSGGRACMREFDGSTITTGEACVVELVAPAPASVCPTNFSYRLVTVPSLSEAIANDQYVTHDGACGACSSLQDLAVFVDYPNLPSRGIGCFNRMASEGFIEGPGTQCYVDLGFSPQCARVLAEKQLRANTRCDANCAAFAIDGDGQLDDCGSDSCRVCLDGRFITTRFEEVAGRTFRRSGLPSQTFQLCDAISTIVETSDICLLAPVEYLNITLNNSTAPESSPTNTTTPSNITSTTGPAPTAAPTLAVVNNTTSESSSSSNVTAPLSNTTTAPSPTAAPTIEVANNTVPVISPPSNVTANTTGPTDVPSNTTANATGPTAAPTMPKMNNTSPTVPPSNNTNITTAEPVPAPTLIPPLADPPQLIFNANTASACRRAADLEESVGALTGTIVTCDCREGDPDPQCFTGADRTSGNVCITLFSECGRDGLECCGEGIRGCRNGVCRLIVKARPRASNRLGSISTIRGSRPRSQVDTFVESGNGGFRRLDHDDSNNYNGKPGTVRGL
eukprot:CAMPEP_0113494092 /NCGR_PEP_ID=MMETSP0014_2-20120614/28930_1 /TAXON_ID=2857 /ORGANISM="Nitzschia sp." /LENGTH=588 /DNA_ID=CAMNT_0000387977 /DNA_START=321 /DNA_END=2087 /DNA_ORIENTATION=- /assembly_acc=CAM_ASM_000159